MPKVRAAVKAAISEFVEEQMDKDPDNARIILGKVLNASKAREAAKKARENARKTKSLVEGGLPGKLADCTCKDPEDSELFLVEG